METDARKPRQDSSVSLIDGEAVIASGHPIRRIKALVNEVLAGMGAHFEEMCIESGRPAIPRERLLKAKGLMALFLVRRDRQGCARLRHDLLFRWFLGTDPDEEDFDAATFSQNETRLLRHQVADLFISEGGAGAGEDAGRGVKRALQCGRNVGGGLGVAGELQAEGPPTATRAPAKIGRASCRERVSSPV